MNTRNFFVAAALGLAALFVFDACEEEENSKLSKDYKLYATCVDRAGGNKAINQKQLTAHEICAMDSLILVGEDPLMVLGSNFGLFSIDNGHIDTVNNRIVVTSGNISTIEDHAFLGTWEGSERLKWFVAKYHESDMGFWTDTLAYFTKQRFEIVDTLKTLFDEGREKNIDKILEIFQSAFEFYPCTGSEFKELVEQGVL